MKHQVFIGVGSNLDVPEKQVLQAFEGLSTLPRSEVVAVSSLMISKPQGPQDQPDFVNAVVEMSTALSPQALLKALQQLEAQQGKVKVRHWGERVIDLDILLYDDWQVCEANLEIPHPQMMARDFVLKPLLEILPQEGLQYDSFAHALKNLSMSYLKP